MKLKINVTQDDIDKGNRGNSNSCPIARVVRGILPMARVNVRYINSIGMGADIALPSEATQFIVSFDNHYPVAPLEFEVDIPENVIDSVGNMDEVRQLLAKSPHLELVEA